jgi:long-chain acyl-CoA synthetase
MSGVPLSGLEWFDTLTIRGTTPAHPSTRRPPPVSSDAPRGVDPSAGRAAARLARTIENALTDTGVSLPQYRMLVFLSDLGNAAASALAGRLGVSRPSVTALADGLVARGYAERVPDPTDRRRVGHVITSAGVEALARADAAVSARLADLAEKIPEPTDRAAAVHGLTIWLAALDAEREARLAEA